MWWRYIATSNDRSRGDMILISTALVEDGQQWMGVRRVMYETTDLGRVATFSCFGRRFDVGTNQISRDSNVQNFF